MYAAHFVRTSVHPRACVSLLAGEGLHGKTETAQNLKQPNLHLIHEVHLIFRLISQLIDSVFCLESELLLPRGVTDGPRPVTDDMITVPRHSVHFSCTIT